MAREKKSSKLLTPEEKLQQALVPENEQPHPIPSNWCWVRLGVLLIEIRNGTTIKQDKSGSGHWVTRIESLQNQTIDFSRLGSIVNEQDIKDTDWYMSGDIALSHINSAEHVGKTALIDADMLPLVHGMNLLRLRFYDSCIPIFFQYYSQSFQYKDEILARINMAVNQVSINQKQISSLEFPLPPLPEQRRIVDRIESLFFKLDEAKEKAQAVVDGFELRKSAILHKAFTGELTEQWRQEHSVRLSDWINTTLSKVVSGFKYGTSEKSNYTNTGMPVLRIPNIDEGILNFEDIKYLSHTDIDKANQIHENDILIIRSNGSRDLVGKCAIVPALEKEYAYASFLIRIKPSERILPHYLVMYLNSTDARTQMFKKAKSSAGINNINSQELGAITISVPPIYEQSAIVTILDSLLVKEQQIKSVAEAVLDQIDTMKKAILALAFRGELGTNDPTEEWAGEILKSVL